MASEDGNKYRAFLSHTTSDKPLVEALARRLTKDGVSCFLDKWHLVPGDPIQESLETALARSVCCVVFIGPSGIGTWQNEEMRAAIKSRISGGMRVVPVLLPGAKRDQRSHLPEFLVSSLWTEFQKSIDEDENYRRLKCGIQGVPPGVSPDDALYEGECPYRGLRVFDSDDARFFFGRDASVDWLLEALAEDSGTPEENRFLGVIGASGSGKSSLVRAGLIPALSEGASRSGKSIAGSSMWPIVVLKPGSEPLNALANALWAEETSQSAVDDTLTLADQMLSDERRLHATIGKAMHDTDERRRFVLVVDQFEELFTQCPPEAEDQRAAFIDNLLYAATIRGGRTLVVITIRADFYGKCSRYPRLAQVLSDDQELVPPLDGEELRWAIEQPARLCGLEFESGLTEMLIQDMRKQPAGALPLLQQALLMLWERRDGRRLTVAAYREIGKLEGALEAHADRLYEELNSDDQRDACRRILRMLTTPGEGTEDTKRRVDRNQLGSGDAYESTLQRLAAGRLITIGDTEPVQVEVAHEALIRGWGRLRNWLDEDREALRTQHQVMDAANEWVSHARDNAFLYSGSRLSQAEGWAKENPEELQQVDVVRRFLQASAQRRNQFTQLGWALAGLFAVLFAFSALLSWGNNRNYRAAQTNAKLVYQQLSNVEFILGTVARDREHDTVKAGHHFLRAAEAARKADDEPRGRSMRIAAAAVDSVVATYVHDRAILGAAFTQDEKRVLTWSYDGSAKLFDVTRNELLASFKHEGTVRGAALTPAATRALTWGDDGTAKLWDVTQDEPLASFKHEEAVRGASFSQAGSRALTWSGDGTANLWDVTQDEPLASFQHERDVNGAAFTQDGKRVLTWSSDNTAKLWDVTQDEPLTSFKHEDAVRGAAFTRDERRVLTWSDDGTAKLWDITQDEPLASFHHENYVYGAAFTQDESRVLTWSRDGTANLWGVTQDEPLANFRHERDVIGAALTQDEKRVLTWSYDGSAKLWDVTQDKPLASFQHENYVYGAAFTQDESRVLTWGSDGTAKLWDVTQDEPLARFQHQGPVRGAAFARDETQVLTWSQDGTARLWDAKQDDALARIHREGVVRYAAFAQDAKRVLTYSADIAKLWDVGKDEPLASFPHEDVVRGAAFAQDATRVLTWSDDGTAKLWDATQGELLATFKHEEAVRGAALTHSATRVLTWSEDGSTKLWDGTQGELLATFKHEEAVHGAALTHNATRVLTWSEDGIAKLWEAMRDEALASFKHEDRVHGAAFTRDATRVLTWSADKTAKLWDIAHDQPLSSFQHEQPVVGAAFTQDEKQVLTWSGDGTAKLWDVAQDEPLASFKHGGPVLGALFTQDETQLLTWGIVGTAKLWDVTQDEPLASFKHEAGVRAATFTQDETAVLTWGIGPKLWEVPVFDGTIEEYELRTGTRIDASGQLRVLSFKEWQERRDRSK